MGVTDLTFVCIGRSHQGVIYRCVIEGCEAGRPSWKERRVSTVDGLLTNAAVCSIQNGVFLAGGDQHGHESDSKKCQTVIWSTSGEKVIVGASQSLHLHRDSSAAITSLHPDYIFISGGDHGDGMEVYCPNQGSWMRMMERLPVECSLHALTVLDSTLYALGGRGEHVLDQCARMCLSAFRHGTPARRLSELLRHGVWESLSGLRVKRHSFAAVTAYGRIIVIGGSNGARSLSSIEIYNPRKDEWRLSHHMLSVPRRNPSALIYQQRYLIVLNGVATNDKLVSQVEWISILDLLNDNANRTFQSIGVSETGTKPDTKLLSPLQPPIGVLEDFETPPPSRCQSTCDKDGSMGSSRLSTKASQAEIKREGLLDGLRERLPKWKNIFPWTRGLTEPSTSTVVEEMRAKTAPTRIEIGTPYQTPTTGHGSTLDPFAFYYN